MRVTRDNIHEVTTNKRKLMAGLLDDIEDINKKNPKLKLYINYIDDEESMWYGMFKLNSDGIPGESIGIEMDIDEIDTSICVISDLLEILDKLREKK